MKKVHFLVACCLAVCLVLGGCAKDKPPLEAPAETDASPELPTEVEERPAEPEVPVEAPVETEETPTEEAQVDAELHGIIAMVACHGRTSTYNIFSIDPSSGNINNVTTFKVVVSSDTDKRTYMPASYYAHSANCQEIFSYDYSKIAVTQTDGETGEVHAGWCDNDGLFSDVTSAINPNSGNGFSDVARQNGIGFTIDGGFIYSDGENIELSPHYVVPIDSLSGNSSQSFGWPEGDSLGEDVYVTDRLDDSRYVVDAQKESTSKIYDAATQTFTDYIPASSRTNWGGVVSPDEQSIAFLSKQPNATGIELFITNIDGGEPVKVSMPQSINDIYGDVWPTEEIFGHAWCTLLDWR